MFELTCFANNESSVKVHNTMQYDDLFLKRSYEGLHLLVVDACAKSLNKTYERSWTKILNSFGLDLFINPFRGSFPF